MRFTLTVILIAIILSACENRVMKSEFDSEIFANDIESNIICFDLSKDLKIAGGLLLKPNDIINPMKRQTLLLPFEVIYMDKSLNIYNSYASYNLNTIVDYSNGVRESAIGFIPKWSNTKDMPSNIYLVSSGLRRNFFYEHKVDNAIWEKLNPSNELTHLGINLPFNAKVFESRDDRNELIKAELEINSVRFYNLKTNKKIELEYLVEAAPSQKKVSDLLLKIAGILLIPTLQFLLFDKQLADERRKKTMKLFLRITIGIQVLLFLTIGYLIYSAFQNGEGIDYSDIILLSVVGISEAIVLWIKKGSS